MRALSLCTVTLALLALTLAACGGGGGDGGKTVVIKKTVTEKAPQQGSETTTTTGQSTPAPATSAPARHLTGFQLPSHNIGCYMSTQFGGNVRCDIRDRTWQPPPKPASCELDWGQGVAFHGDAKAGVVCAGDTTLDKTAPVLAYGQTSQAGPVQCHSAEAGVTCANAGSGHGFFLSRQSYRVF